MQLISRFFEIISPILYGIALAYLFAPVQNFFEYRLLAPLFSKCRKKWVPTFKRVVALILTLLLVTALLAAAFNIIIPSVSASASKLAENLTSYLSDLDANLDEYLETHFSSDSFLTKVYGHVKSALGVDENNTLLSKLAKLAIDWIIGLFSEENIERILSLGSSVLTVLINVLLSVIFMIYLLFSKERQAARLRKICSALFKKERVSKIYRAGYMIDERVGQFLRTRIIESILVGVVSFLVYLILGLPYAPLMALISGVTNIIPYFGPFIGAIPDGLFVLMAAPDKFLAFVIAVLIIQQIDGNVLAPIMQSTTMKIDAFWVLTGLTVMGGIFGLPGMIIGVPVFAVFYILAREKIESRLRVKGLPTDTASYEVKHHERKLKRQKPPIVRLYERVKAKFRKNDAPQDGDDEPPDGAESKETPQDPDGGAAAGADPEAESDPEGPEREVLTENGDERTELQNEEDLIDRTRQKVSSFVKKRRKKK